MKYIFISVCFIFFSVLFAQVEGEGELRETIIEDREFDGEFPLEFEGEFPGDFEGNFPGDDEIDFEGEFDFPENFPEKLIKPELEFKDFSPPEDQVIKDDVSFFDQSEQNDLRDIRFKKLLKTAYIERRVIRRSFKNLLKNTFKSKMTVNRKKSLFKKLAMEVRTLRKNKRSTRFAKKKTNSIIYAKKNQKNKK